MRQVFRRSALAGTNVCHNIDVRSKVVYAPKQFMLLQVAKVIGMTEMDVFDQMTKETEDVLSLMHGVNELFKNHVRYHVCLFLDNIIAIVFALTLEYANESTSDT